MVNAPRHVHHGLGWQDDRMALVVSCDGTVIKGSEFVLTHGEPPEQCPKCGEWLELEWQVRAVVVAPPKSHNAIPGGPDA